MFTKLDIVNQVLNEVSRVSVSNVEDTEQSQIISNKLDLLLPELLARENWNFAVVYRSDSTPLTTDFSPAFRYTYEIPGDFGRLAGQYLGQPNLYQYGFATVDGLIQSNLLPLRYYYIANLCPYEVLPPTFARALIMYCAAKVAPAMTQNLELVTYLQDEWASALNDAILYNENQNPISQLPYNIYNRALIV